MTGLNDVLSKEKEHFSKVKQFEEACEENERLVAKYKQWKARAQAPAQ